MAKDPRDRYQKMEEMRDELRAVLQEVSSGEQAYRSVWRRNRRAMSAAPIQSRGPCAG